MDEDKAVNIGIRSVIDGKAMDGITSFRIHSGPDMTQDRWAEFVLSERHPSPHTSHLLQLFDQMDGGLHHLLSRPPGPRPGSGGCGQGGLPGSPAQLDGDEGGRVLPPGRQSLHGPG